MSDRPEMSWINDRLAIGGRFDESDLEHMANTLQIGSIVDLRAECCDDPELLLKRGIAFLHLPTEDLQPIAGSALSQGVEWVCAALEAGRRVLIHCEHGIGRSALLACCVLVARGFTPIEALTKAKQVREKVSPSPDQLHAFLNWVNECRACRGMAALSVAWSDLAAIAYRSPSFPNSTKETP